MVLFLQCPTSKCPNAMRSMSWFCVLVCFVVWLQNGMLILRCRNSQPTPRRALRGKKGARAGPWGQFPRALNRGPPKLVSPFSHVSPRCSPFSPPFPRFPRFSPFFPVFPPVWRLEFLWHGYYGALYGAAYEHTPCNMNESR